MASSSSRERVAATTRPRLVDVAARAGVSNSTVSLVLNASGPVAPATRERVLAAASALGYAGPDPRARSLRKGRSGVVAVVLEDALSSSFRDPMNLALLDGIAEAFEGSGLSLLLLPDAIDDPSRLASAPFDAAVLLGCSTALEVQLEPLRRRRVPIVAVEAPPMADVTGIDLENREASAAGARHLRELGHTRVATVVLPLGPGRPVGPLTPEVLRRASVTAVVERLEGAREVFPDLEAVGARASSVEEGMRAAAELLARPDGSRPTAILAQSDLLAVGVLREAERLGLRVPGDLSVVGFDGIALDGATDAVLTTLVQPGVEKGVAVGRAVLAALAGERPRPASFAAELRIGTTTAPPAR